MFDSKTERAIDSAMRRLDIANRYTDNSDPELVSEMQQIANLHFVMMDYAKAKLLYWSILDAQLTRFGAYHHDCIETLISLGEVYEAEMQYKVAEHFYKSALNVLEQSKQTNAELQTRILFRLYGSYRSQELNQMNKQPDSNIYKFPEIQSAQEESAVAG